MTDTKEILDASPTALPVDTADVAAAIDACLSCLQTCSSCADADLAEDDVEELRTCIARCLTCADVCELTARTLSRPGSWDRLVVHGVLQACLDACAVCAEECERHAAHHHHCALCAQTCNTCIRACQVLLDSGAFEQ
jgi:uncharacterized membrane protein